MIVGILAAYLIDNSRNPSLGNALVAASGTALVIGLLWNTVWVNCVLYRITQKPSKSVPR